MIPYLTTDIFSAADTLILLELAADTLDPDHGTYEEAAARLDLEDALLTDLRFRLTAYLASTTASQATIVIEQRASA